MSRINVMHLIDTLDAGGAERVAVNIANLLPRRKISCSFVHYAQGGIAL